VTNQEYNDEILSRYLLGALDVDTTERLDELSIADDETAARLLIIENDLVDAYVGGELSGNTLAQFESFYLKSPKRREKVSFARALRVHEGKTPGVLVTEADRTSGSEARRSRKENSERASWWRFFAGPIPALQWGLAAAAILLLLAGGYLMFENLRLRNQIAQTQAQRAELEQRERELQRQLAEQRSVDAETEKELAAVRAQLAELEQQSNANRQGDLKIVAFSLSPQTRGISQIKPLPLPAGTDYVAVTLELDANDFQAYRASLKNPASGQVVWGSGKLVPNGKNPSVRLRLPASLLKQQNYALELFGISTNGASEIVGSYAFKVVIQ